MFKMLVMPWSWGSIFLSLYVGPFVRCLLPQLNLRTLWSSMGILSVLLTINSTAKWNGTEQLLKDVHKMEPMYMHILLNIFNSYNETETTFFSFQVVSAFGKEEAERKFETLLNHLSHPPSFTTVRVNTHLASVQHVKNLLFDELQKVCVSFLCL